ICLISTPAQKPRPSAATITAHTAGSAPAAATAPARSNQPCTGSALTGGKSMTTSAIPPLLRRSIPMPRPRSHRRRPAQDQATQPSVCLGRKPNMWPMRAVDYTGRAVIVTGGTRGIGAGIARAFLRAGAQVLVCGRTGPSDDAPLPGADGRTAAFTQADVRDPAQAQRLVQSAAELFGRVDVVVSNA